jgi:hypothetical protein
MHFANQTTGFGRVCCGGVPKRGGSAGGLLATEVFYPKSGFTKGHVTDYYIRVSSYLLPHLKERSITFKR